MKDRWPSGVKKQITVDEQGWEENIKFTLTWGYRELPAGLPGQGFFFNPKRESFGTSLQVGNTSWRVLMMFRGRCLV